MLVREMRFGLCCRWIGGKFDPGRGGHCSGAVHDYGPVSLAWGEVASNTISAVGFSMFLREARWLRPSLRGWSEPLPDGWLVDRDRPCRDGGDAGGPIVDRQTLGLGRPRSVFPGTQRCPAMLARSSMLLPFSRPCRLLRAPNAKTREGWSAFICGWSPSSPGWVGLRTPSWQSGRSRWWCFSTVSNGGRRRRSPGVVPWQRTPAGAHAQRPTPRVHRRVRLLFMCETGLLINWLVLLISSSVWLAGDRSRLCR